MSQLPLSGRDFDQLKSSMLARVPELAPLWTNLNEGDMGVALINLVAGVGDMLGYYIDRMGDEVFITTVVQRANMKRLAALIDYSLSRAVAATTTLRFSLPAPAVSNLVIPKYTQVKTNDGLYFVTKQDVTIFTGQSSVDVLGYQGAYQLDSFTGTGAAEQAYSLTGQNLAQNFVIVLVGNVQWQEDASDTSASLSTVYKVETDDAESAALLFSTFMGGVPQQNTPILVHSIETKGAAGNIGSGIVSKIMSSIVGGSDLTVTNTTASTGGRDRETVEEARIKAPRNLRRLGRVVSLQDYKDALEALTNVASAQAINHNGYVECYAAPAQGGSLFTPAPVIALAAGSGGTFAAGTYKVAVTATDAAGESSTFEYNPTNRAVIDQVKSITLSLNQKITVTVTPSPGATGYRVYISNDSGATWKLAAAGGSTTTVITAMPASANVTVPVVNTTGVRASSGTKSLKQEAEDYLEAFRSVCTTFAIFNPTYVSVNVTATVRIFDNYLQSDRQGAVQTALTAFFAAGQRQFGEAVNLSDLYRLLMDVEGVRAVNFTAPTTDTTIAAGQIAVLGTASLTMSGGVVG